MLMWVGANEKYEKRVPAWLKDLPLTQECEQPWYNPMYQMLTFAQNSWFFHLYHNQHLLKSKYVGFGQYDMSYQAAPFRELEEKLKHDNGDTFASFFYYPFQCLFDLLGPQEWQDTFLNQYNEEYGTSHTLESLSKLPLALLHSFIVPKPFFVEMMRFIEYLLPTTLKALQFKNDHIAGTLERVFALYISCACMEGKFKQILHVKAAEHEDSQHVGCEVRGVGPRGDGTVLGSDGMLT